MRRVILCLFVALFVAPSCGAQAAEVPAPPHGLTVEECSAWYAQTRRSLVAAHLERERPLFRAYADALFDSRRDVEPTKARLDAENGNHAADLRLLVDYLRQCRFEAQARRGSRAMLARLVPAASEGSLRHEAYARLSPALGQMSLVGGYARRVGQMLSLPSLLARLSPGDPGAVSAAHEAVQGYNAAFTPGFFFRSLNRQTLGLLQAMHEDAFRQLDGALGSIAGLSVDSRMEQARQSALQVRTLLVAQQEEMSRQVASSSREISPDIVATGNLPSDAAAARARERAQVAAQQQQSPQQPRQPTASAGGGGAQGGDCSTLDGRLTASFNRSVASQPEGSCAFMRALPAWWSQWRSAAAQCSGELLRHFDQLASEVRATASQICN